MVETKQNMKKVLLVFWGAIGPHNLYLTFMGCYKGHFFLKFLPLQNHLFFKQKFINFLNSFLHVRNVQTNKQTLVYMSEANTPKTSVCAPLVRLYKILLCFALRPLVSEISKYKFFPLAGFWITRIFHGSWINLSRE